MSATQITTQIPGYVTGTWDIDAGHSEVGFSVRHMMVSKVKGRFSKFSGQITTAENPADSSVTATVELASIDTNSPERDTHLRGADFFDTERYENLSFRSTGVRADLNGNGGGNWAVDGELTLHGVTRPVTLALELNGFAPDPWGNTRVGFSATTSISRKDFDIDFNIPMDGGGVVVGDKIQVNLEIEAVLQK